MLEHLLWNTAIVATAYAWIRFCDWKLKPWMKARKREAEIRKEGERILLQSQLDAINGLTMRERDVIMKAKGFK